MPSSISSSEPKLARPFDDDIVTRDIPNRPWRALFAAALAAAFAVTLGWELYWRGHWLSPNDFKNTAGLWAQERRKAKGDATVIIGSSRILFDIDLDVWEEISGVRPIQLALEGTSPQPILADLAADPEFNGLVVVGVTAPLTFSGYALRGDVVSYAKSESPSQRIDHFLAMQLEKVFAFIDDSTRPKTMLFHANWPLREGMSRRMEPRKLMILGPDRNAEMSRRVIEDEDFRQLAKDVWADGINPRLAPLKDPNSPAFAEIEKRTKEIITAISADVEKIRARGGEVAFARMPYDGLYAEFEDLAYPREKAWDRLLEASNSFGVHFADYPALQGHYIVEWSHLAPRDAERFTAAFVPIFYDLLEKRKSDSEER